MLTWANEWLLAIVRQCLFVEHWSSVWTHWRPLPILLMVCLPKSTAVCVPLVRVSAPRLTPDVAADLYPTNPLFAEPVSVSVMAYWLETILYNVHYNIWSVSTYSMHYTVRSVRYRVYSYFSLLSYVHVDLWGICASTFNRVRVQLPWFDFCPNTLATEAFLS